MDNEIITILQNLSDSQKKPESEYLGEDGLLHCSVCHEPTQTRKECFGILKTFRCVCSCERKQREAMKAREEQEEIERKRMICFGGTNMESWCFENDDHSNPELSKIGRNYVENFREFLNEGKGLLLYGSVGSGKTYISACIANSLISDGYSALMTNFGRIVNRMQGSFSEKQNVLESLNRYSLLVLDDLGAERSTEYMQEMVYNIVDWRYRSGKPMIVTTNLTGEQMKATDNIQLQRTYDRIFERCLPIEVNGQSRRKQKLAAGAADMRRKLGI